MSVNANNFTAAITVANIDGRVMLGVWALVLPARATLTMEAGQKRARCAVNLIGNARLSGCATSQNRVLLGLPETQRLARVVLVDGRRMIYPYTW